jgi:hypothetical protein
MSSVQEVVVPDPVVLEREPRPMRLVNVEFDPELLRLPIRIELVPGDEDVHRGLRQPRLPHQLEESTLEPGAGELALRPIGIEGGTNLSRPVVSRRPIEELPHLAQVEDLEFIGPLDVTGDGPRPGVDGKIEDRPGHGGDGDPVAHRSVDRRQIGPVHDEWALAGTRASRGEVDGARPRLEETPQPSGRQMAGDGGV